MKIPRTTSGANPDPGNLVPSENPAASVVSVSMPPARGSPHPNAGRLGDLLQGNLTFVME